MKAQSDKSHALTEWLRENAPDCGDNSCLFGGRGKGGMRTNGGCRCFKDVRPDMKRIFINRLWAAFTLSHAPRNLCPVSFPHQPHDFCDGTPEASRSVTPRSDITVQLVRQAIFHVLDGREWDFGNDEQRVDFADAVATWIPTERT